MIFPFCEMFNQVFQSVYVHFIFKAKSMFCSSLCAVVNHVDRTSNLISNDVQSLFVDMIPLI